MILGLSISKIWPTRKNTIIASGYQKGQFPETSISIIK